MAAAARVSLRAPPHLPFVQGWPGIPEDGRGRKQPAVQGTVEVRVGNAPVKAKWVRVELRKYEALPGSVSVNQGQSMWSHVGQICDLWKASEGKEWELLQTADYKFHLPLPDNIPPTVELPKGGGIHYELVAAICYRQKGGLLKKESAPIMKTTEHVRISKHELHSAWPLYLIPDTRMADKDGINLSVHRPSTAFGPGDRVMLSASVRSDRPRPLRLQGFFAQVVEITTLHVPPAKRVKATSTIRTRTIAEVRAPVNEMLGQGEDKVRRLTLQIPGDGLLVTTNNAKMLEIQYELNVKAVFEGIEDAKVEKLRYIVGVFPHNHAVQAVRDIGHFSALCPGTAPPPPQPMPPMTPTGSINSFQHQQQQQQYHHPIPPPQQPLWNPHSNGGSPVQPNSGRPPVDPFPAQQLRRPSSSGSTMTTQTTHTNRQSMDFSPAPVDRPYSTMGSPSPAHPATYQPGLASRSQSYTSIPHRDDESSKRYSAYSAQTFGGYRPAVSGPSSDNGTDASGTGAGDHESQISFPSNRPTQRFSVVNADPKPRIPKARQSVGGSGVPLSSSAGPSNQSPRPWESAEDEKTRLYAEARSRAAQTQQGGGASLTRIGMDEAIPAFDPPEYAPQAIFPVPRPTSASPPTSPPGRILDLPPSLPKAYLSAAEEKEQQKQRFEQAQRKAVPGVRNRALTVVGESESEQQQSTSSSPPPSAWTHGRQVSGAPKFETAAEEKERLRYEMAIERREQFAGDASGSSSVPAVTDEPVPYDALFSAQGPDLAATNVQSSAIDEKEQMRRYHEARDRVAGGSGSGSFNADGPKASLPTSSSNNPQAPYLTADQEKDLMRRRYEDATRAVAQGHSVEAEAETGGGTSLAGTSVNREPAVTQEYMSAEQEKAIMRQRFEAATQAVNARGQSLSPPSSPRPEDFASNSLQEYDVATGGIMSGMRNMNFREDSRSQSPAEPTRKASSQPYMSAEAEKDLMRRRYEEATGAVTRGSESASHTITSSSAQRPLSVIGNGFASQPANGSLSRTGLSWNAQQPPADAPPPPLPTRPPAEYINLLSPVDAPASDLPPWATHDGRASTASQLGAGPSIYGAFNHSGDQR